jgi:hypothetical protein
MEYVLFIFTFTLFSLLLLCPARVFGVSLGQCIGEGDALQLLSETRPSLSDQQARRAVTAIFRACRTTLASASLSQSASPALGSLNAHSFAYPPASMPSSAPLVSTSSPGTRHLAPMTYANDSTASASLRFSPSLQSSSASPAFQMNDLGGVGVSSNLVGGSPSSTHHPPVLHRARERVPSNSGTSSASANFSSTTVLGLVEGSAAGFASLVLPPSFSSTQPHMRHQGLASSSSAASSATPSPRLSPASSPPRSPRRTDALHQHPYHQLADMGGALGMQLNSMLAAGKDDTVVFSRFCKAALLFSHARGTVGADMDFELFAFISKFLLSFWS